MATRVLEITVVLTSIFFAACYAMPQYPGIPGYPMPGGPGDLLNNTGVPGGVTMPGGLPNGTEVPGGVTMPAGMPGGMPNGTEVPGGVTVPAGMPGGLPINSTDMPSTPATPAIGG